MYLKPAWNVAEIFSVCALRPVGPLRALGGPVSLAAGHRDWSVAGAVGLPGWYACVRCVGCSPWSTSRRYEQGVTLAGTLCHRPAHGPGAW